MEWRKMGDSQKVDLIPYITNYLREKPDAQIMIGSDSQSVGKKTKYAIVIGLHTNRGAHILYQTITFPKITDRFQRLMKEVEYTIEVGETLKNGLFLKRSKDGYGNYPLLSLHFDLNLDRKYDSNRVLVAVLGWAESMGYCTEYKPRAISASYAADVLCKR